jgi:SnoaL-like domain
MEADGCDQVTRLMPKIQGRGDSHVGQEAVQTMFGAWERWDLETVESLVADDAVDRRPQSGERFVGRANIMAMYHEVPGPPKITWRSVRGGPTVWVGEGIVEYGEGPVRLVSILEFADEKMTTADHYFAEPFEPPPSRSRWAARTNES